MLIAALIFVISLAAVIQFAVLSWRAALLKAAFEPLPAGWEPLSNSTPKSFSNNGFVDIAAYSKLCPDLGGDSGSKLRSLRIYYRFLQLCEGLSRAIAPQNACWATREMALCTRCATVMLSHRLERTQALSAAARSF
jgi:hypothetical protein